VVLFSDGVTEAQDAEGEEFGEARLAEVVSAASVGPAGEIVTRVFDAIDTFAGDAPQYDDITLLVVKR
jgi:sigma-B regulation protein RsbU (phosphoserine phosphatase)